MQYPNLPELIEREFFLQKMSIVNTETRMNACSMCVCVCVYLRSGIFQIEVMFFFRVDLLVRYYRNREKSIALLSHFYRVGLAHSSFTFYISRKKETITKFSGRPPVAYKIGTFFYTLSSFGMLRLWIEIVSLRACARSWNALNRLHKCICILNRVEFCVFEFSALGSLFFLILLCFGLKWYWLRFSLRVVKW